MKDAIYLENAFPSVELDQMQPGDYSRQEFVNTVEYGLTKMEWAAVMLACAMTQPMNNAKNPDGSPKSIPEEAAELAECVLLEVAKREKAVKAERRRIAQEAKAAEGEQ